MMANVFSAGDEAEDTDGLPRPANAGHAWWPLPALADAHALGPANSRNSPSGRPTRTGTAVNGGVDRAPRPRSGSSPRCATPFVGGSCHHDGHGSSVGTAWSAVKRRCAHAGAGEGPGGDPGCGPRRPAARGCRGPRRRVRVSVASRPRAAQRQERRGGGPRRGRDRGRGRADPGHGADTVRDWRRLLDHDWRRRRLRPPRGPARPSVRRW